LAPKTPPSPFTRSTRAKPDQFHPVSDTWDYNLHDVMIPMRDGVKLHTIILVPKGASRTGMLLTRTPYEAKTLTGHTHSGHLGPMLQGYDNATDVILEDGYIRVVQDVRGKYGSEGDYVMNRPVHGPQNPTPVDDATDTYDTIEWLVKNVPESNGKVGTLGISYDGFEPLMALINPHPALKVSVPMNPMVDGWMGDDWFHFGAFRQQNMQYIYEQVASRDNIIKWFRLFPRAPLIPYLDPTPLIRNSGQFVVPGLFVFFGLCWLGGCVVGGWLWVGLVRGGGVVGFVIGVGLGFIGWWGGEGGFLCSVWIWVLLALVVLFLQAARSGLGGAGAQPWHAAAPASGTGSFDACRTTCLLERPGRWTQAAGHHSRSRSR